MSFHEITGIPPNMPISAEQFPVFLFPDITGDCLGLLQLAHQLQIARGNKSPIYIWHDPKTSEAGQSLDTYAEKIKNEIIKLLPVGPCYLGGYSFGGGLGSVVAQKLGEAKRKASLFVIDTPSIEGSQAYLQPQNAAATQDLVAIFNYAASLACHYTGQKMENPALSEESFLALCKLPLAEQLASLKDLYIQAALQAETTESETKVAAVLQTKSSAEQLQLLRAQVKTINAEELLALAQKTPVEQLAFLKTALIKQNKDDKLSGLLTQYAAVATQNLLSLLKHQDQRT
jgi:thioesterase domain-containing protein